MIRSTKIGVQGVVASAIAIVLVQPVDPHVDQEGVDKAVAVVRPTAGNDVHGVVRFIDVAGGVRVTAEISGLAPNSKRGFHLHEYGDATAPDGTSAGGHYDPDDTGMHARPNAEMPHHAGDLGNIAADDSGKATYQAVIRGISVAGVESPIIGRSVIIHAKPDQFDQPTGSAGPRIGIGIIGVANPESSEQQAG